MSFVRHCLLGCIGGAAGKDRANGAGRMSRSSFDWARSVHHAHPSPSQSARWLDGLFREPCRDVYHAKSESPIARVYNRHGRLMSRSDSCLWGSTLCPHGHGGDKTPGYAPAKPVLSAFFLCPPSPAPHGGVRGKAAREMAPPALASQALGASWALAYLAVNVAFFLVADKAGFRAAAVVSGAGKEAVAAGGCCSTERPRWP